MGRRWADKIRRLGKHNLLPGGMLVAVQAPSPKDRKLRAATDEIMADLRDIGLEVAEADDTASITRFAQAAAATPIH